MERHINASRSMPLPPDLTPLTSRAELARDPSARAPEPLSLMTMERFRVSLVGG